MCNIHTYLPTYLHTYTYTHIYIYTYTHIYIQTYRQTYRHTGTYRDIHVFLQRHAFTIDMYIKQNSDPRIERQQYRWVPGQRQSTFHWFGPEISISSHRTDKSFARTYGPSNHNMVTKKHSCWLQKSSYGMLHLLQISWQQALISPAWSCCACSCGPARFRTRNSLSRIARRQSGLGRLCSNKGRTDAWIDG